MSKQYVERRLYFNSDCEGCGRKYQSFKRSRVKKGLCRKCRSEAAKVDPNQVPLFVDDAGVLHLP